MSDHLLNLANRFGPWVALCAALLAYLAWLTRQTLGRSQERERHLAQRLAELEERYREDLRTTLRQAAGALQANSTAFHAAAAALHELALAIRPPAPWPRRHRPTKVAADHE
jgi:hypothetical protein